MIRFYRFPKSTNCDRLALALAHKGLRADSIQIDPADRSLVRKVSGQDLVPVLDIDGEILVDSMPIIRRVEELYPAKPLYPADAARRAEMQVFIDWFNRVWKVPPNAMEAEMKKPSPDQAKIDRWSAEMKGHLDTFEAILSGRSCLMGDEFSAADVCAWPFLRYAAIQDDDDPYLFHRILVEHQPLGSNHPRLESWIRRLSDRPMV